MTTISCKDLGHFPDTGQQSVEFLRFPLTKASISILLRVHHKLWGIILGMVQPKRTHCLSWPQLPCGCCHAVGQVNSLDKVLHPNVKTWAITRYRLAICRKSFCYKQFVCSFWHYQALKPVKCIHVCQLRNLDHKLRDIIMGKVQRKVLADFLGHKGLMNVDALLSKTAIAVKSCVTCVVTTTESIALGSLLVQAGNL